MPRVKKYIDVDVYTEAKKRIHHIYDTFDSIVVCFSGGKDSLVTLRVTWEVAQERGLSHVDVVFRDEELVPQVVIDFVDEYRLKPWVKMLYFAVPLHSRKYILGVSYPYVQWDPGRRHVRPIPEHAIKLEPGDSRVFDQYTMDAYVAKYFRGRIALVTGVRAAESIVRFRSVVNKLNDNYITAPAQLSGMQAPANVKTAKPIYDWSEDDIFKYLYDKGVPYCTIYDRQVWAGESLRVSTPLHAEAAKRFDRLKVLDPQLYAQIIDIFPEMLAHERYFTELDRKAIIAKYSSSLEGIRAWIEDHIDEAHEKALAITRLNSVASRHRRTPESYPLPYIMRQFVNGAYKRQILPQGPVRGKKKHV